MSRFAHYFDLLEDNPTNFKGLRQKHFDQGEQLELDQGFEGRHINSGKNKEKNKPTQCHQLPATLAMILVTISYALFK